MHYIGGRIFGERVRDMQDKARPNGSAATPNSIEATLRLLRSADYVADRALATVLFLALRLGRPLFLEGEAGVGKTEIAKVLAQTLGRKLIRLQCYEGLDVAAAVYEWNYAAADDGDPPGRSGRRDTIASRSNTTYSRDAILIKRAAAAGAGAGGRGPPVLLIDELDRTDEAFEAFLLEILSDFQVTIPELGTIKADHPPIVIITSNRTREIHDALKRRCLYHWVDYPDAAREIEIVRAKRPGAPRTTDARRSCCSCRSCASMDLFKLARRRRNARLGHGADRARRGRARPGARSRHARRAAQVPGRHRKIDRPRRRRSW